MSLSLALFLTFPLPPPSLERILYIVIYFSASRKSKCENLFFLSNQETISNECAKKKKREKNQEEKHHSLDISETFLLVLSFLLDADWYFFKFCLLLFAVSFAYGALGVLVFVLCVCVCLNRKTKNMYTTLHVNRIMEYPDISLRSK